MIKFLVLMVLFSGVAYAEVKQEPQKFNGKFTINYNSTTLQEASELEKRIKKEHKNACWVKSELSAKNDFDSSLAVFSDGGFSA